MTVFQNDITTGDGYLGGQLLVAMPGIQDARFAKAVIYVCVHTADGAMGLVLNRIIQGMPFQDLLQQLEISTGSKDIPDLPIHFGGPVESGRGFVLHTPEYKQDNTISISDEASLTATVDILQDIAGGKGPGGTLLALGYAGWAPGQLDQEIQANGWLTVPADTDLLFGKDVDRKWNKALEKIGIRLDALSGDAGHA